MIKINLCPIDELESQYWYVPDVAAALVVAAGCFFGVQYYLGKIQAEIDVVMGQTASLEASTQQLQPSIDRVKNLEKSIAELKAKREALQAITTSKIAKYKPIIVMEHLQNLMPEGVWYHNMKVGIQGSERFEVKGQAFDNILVAELMTVVKSTAYQEGDASDLRTQVYFDDVELGGSGVPKEPPNGFPELAKFTEFTINGAFVERGYEVRPEPVTDVFKAVGSGQKKKTTARKARF